MQYCDLESNTIELKITNENGDNTFSAASVRNIFNEIACFIGSRIIRAWQHNPVSPKTMTIKIKVTID